MRRCALVLATALLSVTALAGCGSADDEAADDTDTTTSSSTEDESPDTDETGDADDQSDKKDKKEKAGKAGKNDESGGSEDSDDADDTKKNPKKKSGKTKPAKADYCDLVKSLKADFDPSNSASMAASRDIDAVADRLEDITENAPANVRPSWQRLTTTLEGFADVLDKYDIDLTDKNAFNKLKPKERKALSRSAQKYQTPQVSKATSTIERDTKRRCNISLG